MLLHGPRKSLFVVRLERENTLSPYTARMKVEVGDQVSRGAALTEGSIQPKRLLAVRDVLSVETYLLAEVQKSIP